MNIKWVKCGDRMPPDNRNTILARHPKINKPPIQVWGFILHINKARGMLNDKWEWAELK